MRIALVALLFITSLAALADAYQGRVVRVTDGDTITVLDTNNVQHKVRLAGIDAPEKKQAFGNVSRQNLAQLVFGKTVTIETRKTDRYRREIGKVLVGEMDANLQQVKDGLAWHYKKYQKEQLAADRDAYARAEDEARGSHIGLWKDPTPVPPWEFRHPGKK